jgi:hypothetical protein
MAVSPSFGLAFATLLVLFFVPALLLVHESVAQRFSPAGSSPSPARQDILVLRKAPSGRSYGPGKRI